MEQIKAINTAFRVLSSFLAHTVLLWQCSSCCNKHTAGTSITCDVCHETKSRLAILGQCKFDCVHNGIAFRVVMEIFLRHTSFTFVDQRWNLFRTVIIMVKGQTHFSKDQHLPYCGTKKAHRTTQKTTDNTKWTNTKQHKHRMDYAKSTKSALSLSICLHSYRLFWVIELWNLYSALIS